MADQAAPAAPDAPAFDPTPDPTLAAPAAATTPTTPPAAPPSSPWAGSPWAEKLDGLQDGLTREQVHELWQGTVQPYVTQKEQELGQVGTIWEQLQGEDTSIPTYLALAEQMYGPEVAQTIADGLQQHFDEGAQAADDEGAVDWEDQETYDRWFEQQPPWVQAQEEQRIANEEDATYQAEVKQFAPDVIDDGVEHILARYVVAADGDVQAAKQLYDQEFGPIIAHAKSDPAVAAQYGLSHLHGQVAAPAAPAPAGAPTVLGATGAGGSSVPAQEEPRYATLDDAMDDLFAAVSGTGPHLQQ